MAQARPSKEEFELAVSSVLLTAMNRTGKRGLPLAFQVYAGIFAYPKLVYHTEAPPSVSQ